MLKEYKVEGRQGRESSGTFMLRMAWWDEVEEAKAMKFVYFVQVRRR